MLGMAVSSGLGAQSFSRIYAEDYSRAHGYGVQGGAVCSDYLFQCHDKAPAIVVYDLARREAVADLPLPGVKTWHCNNACFSAYWYAPGDEFPLLYISQEHASEHCAIVVRITRDGTGTFAADIVQKIVFPSPLEMGVWYPNIALDLQQGWLYVEGYSSPSWKDAADGNALHLVRFAMPAAPAPEGAYAGSAPKPAELPVDETLGCPVLTLSTADIQMRRTSTFRVATQGACIRNGKLFQAFGVPGCGPLSLCCTSLADGRLEWSRDLPSIGIDEEPETLGFYHDSLLVVSNVGNVYLSDCVEPWKLADTLAHTAPAWYAGARKKLVCLDLDATLTQHRTHLNATNRAALANLCNHYQTVMVCAGNAPRVRGQMEDFPIAIIGNYGMQEAHDENGKLVIDKQITIPADTAFFLRKTNALRRKYGYTEYKGDPVEFHASGMVTFGLLGTKAVPEEKVVFDPDRARRRAMYPEVLKIFKNYSVYIGGSSSFDFAGKRFNKYDAVMEYAKRLGLSRDEVIFIGDDFDDGGGDSHVRIYGMDYISIDDYRLFPQRTSGLVLPR